jgi:hypothetical protein
MHTIPFTPATDSLGHTAPLDQRATFPLLGVPLEIRSNSSAVIAAAERAFGGWRGLDPELIDPAELCVVSIIVHEEPRTENHRITEPQSREPQNREPGALWANHTASVLSSQVHSANGNGTGNGAGTSAHATEAVGIRTLTPEPRTLTPFVQRLHSDCFLASDGANMLMAQRPARQAMAFVTPELVADEPRLRHHVLELLGLLLATYRDRLPVHAGAVVRQGRAVLLTGRSTAGKSTLCYACLRGGFQLLAEDVVYVSMRRGMRLWGVPWQIHLLPDAVRHFAELADVPVALQANGKFKLAVETSSFGADRPRRYVERAIVCMVERHAGVSSALERIDPCIPIAAMTHDLESGFDLYGDPRAAIEALVADGAYRLHVGSDLAAAVALLKELTDGEIRD